MRRYEIRRLVFVRSWMAKRSLNHVEVGCLGSFLSSTLKFEQRVRYTL